MKKIYLISVLLILSFGIYFLFLKNNEEVSSIPEFDDTTYEFTGKSNHFQFKTGKIYFDRNFKRFYISDFSQNSRISNLKEVYVTILCEDKKISFSSDAGKDNVSRLSYYEGDVCDEDVSLCEFSALDLTTKENFKDIFKVEITYCTDEGCFSEFFDIEYNK